MKVILFIFCLLFTTILCFESSSDGTDPLKTCNFPGSGGKYFDLSPLMIENYYSYQDKNNNNYYFSFCSDSLICQKYLGQTGVQACSTFSKSELYYELGSISSASYSINSDGTGVTLNYNSSGEVTCESGYYRSDSFNFVCDRSTEFLVSSFYENPPCKYNFVINSQLACAIKPIPTPSPTPSPTETPSPTPTPTPTESPTPTPTETPTPTPTQTPFPTFSPSPNPNPNPIPSDCIFKLGSQFVDLSPLNSSSFSGYQYFDNSSNSDIFFNFCSPNEYCSQLFNNQIQSCQKQNPYEYIISCENTGFYNISSEGLVLQYNSGYGLYCEDGVSQKTISYHMVCNTSTNFEISNFINNNDCSFIFEIQSEYACVTSPTPSPTPSPSHTNRPTPTPTHTNKPTPTPTPTPMETCKFQNGGSLIDLSPLKSVEHNIVYLGVTFYFGVCNTSPWCDQEFGNTTIQSCGENVTNSFAAPLGVIDTGTYSFTIDPVNQESGITLSYTTKSVCAGNLYKSSDFVFNCNPSYDFVVYEIFEYPECHFQFKIATKNACPINNSHNNNKNNKNNNNILIN